MYTSPRPRAQLGFAPVLAAPVVAAGSSFVTGVTSFVGSVTGLASVLGKLGLNSSDPVKDQQRITRIDHAFAGAMAGSTAPTAEFGGLGPLPYLQEMAADGGRNAGSQVAYRYAQVKLAEYQARHAAGVVGGGLVNAGGGLIAESDLPTTVVGTVTRALSNPMVLGGIALGAFLLLRKKR